MVPAWTAAYLGLCAVVGLGCAVLWKSVVRLPSYTVAEDRTAATSERGLTQFFAGDAWFVGIGLLVGIALGLIGWRWFNRIGWPTVLVVLIGSLVAALVCAHLGHRLGPSELNPRLLAAQPGDVVPIELMVRAKATYAVWALGAIAPVLIRASLGRDPEDLPPQRSTS